MIARCEMSSAVRSICEQRGGARGDEGREIEMHPIELPSAHIINLGPLNLARASTLHPS